MHANSLSQPLNPSPNQQEMQLVHIIEALAQGDFSVNVSDPSNLGVALQTLIQQLRISKQRELDRTVKLSMCSNETSISSARLLYSLADTDERAQSIAAAAEQLQASVQQIRNHSREVKTHTQASLNTMGTVTGSLQTSISAFENIKLAVEDNAQKVTEMGSFATEIRDIAETIKGIAFQTKLLALNASVEAARAGTVGAGFGVVADEMRNLSTRSTNATKQITNLVDAFEEKMNLVSGSLDSSVSNVEQGKIKIQEVEQQVLAMKTNISDATENVNQITHAIAEQSEATDNVSDGIMAVASSTAESVSSTDHIVDSMNELQEFINDHITELGAQNIPNKIIKLAQSDHVIWKKRLVNMICGKEGLNEHELADHHSCRLGKWYDKVSDSTLKNHPAFKELLQPHEEVHRHGRRAVALYNQGKLREALAEIDAVEASSVHVLRILQTLEQL